MRSASLEDFKQHEFIFLTSVNKLLLSYKARYFPESLTADEQSNWLHSCRERLTKTDTGYLTLDSQQAEIEQLLNNNELPVKSREILKKLEDWRH